ncbi:larval/pupal cuticle protein H1C-like [Plodia interpunctella]|uniref:larval/pupal cuticle protein H1C-like n=1 Tax=Plodia interpunctella TaxID=58824 RepID=UPI0023679DE2|nr:larval/pupal cuticle protein H1C-like [Plodia interpunctella]
MKTIVAFTALLACAAAAPGLLVTHETPVVATVHAAPVVHSVPVLAAKTTITKSSQVVNHGTPLVHAPVVHAVHAAPVVHTVHAAPVVHAVHAAPVVLKTAPVAVAHTSSVVHHAPVVKALPVIAVHH